MVIQAHIMDALKGTDIKYYESCNIYIYMSLAICIFSFIIYTLPFDVALISIKVQKILFFYGKICLFFSNMGFLPLR